jgi:hypothetical protein
MLTLITKGITLYIVSWVLWRFLRRFVVKTDLDNVPGPASHSLFKGMSRDIYLPCHLNQVSIKGISQNSSMLMLGHITKSLHNNVKLLSQ